MKGVIGALSPEPWLSVFTGLLHWFDQQDEGCVFQIVSEAKLTPGIYSHLARRLPQVDLHRFDRDSR